MPEFLFSRKDDTPRNGFYEARIQGVEGVARIAFTRHDDDLISADHTEAPESMQGTGAAAALVAYLVEDARRDGLRIIPICPYVRAQYKKHPEWTDVFTVQPGEVPELGNHRTWREAFAR